MRYEAVFDSYNYWWGGRERTITAHTSTLTMTRRAATLAFRLVRRNKKTRWSRTFRSEAAARASFSTLERALIGAGFRLKDGEDIKLPTPDPLESWKSACYGAEGDDARLVYADVLTERRDPRGELIVAQSRAEDDESGVQIAARLLTTHRALFLGPLIGREERLCATWRRGFVDSIVLSPDIAGYDADRVGLLVDVLTHPSGELLRELTLGIDTTELDSKVKSVSEVIAVLAALAPQGLEELTVQSAVSRRNEPSAGDVSTLLGSLPRLTSFFADGVEVTMTYAFEAPTLVRLRLAGPFNEASAATLIASALPRLEQLELRTPTPLSAMSRIALSERFGSRLLLETGDVREPPTILAPNPDDYYDNWW